MILAGDVETTGTNVYCSEVITGYFELYDEKFNFLDCYDLRSQVLSWSEEAEEIHGISEMEMLSYPTKAEAWGKFNSWIPKSFSFMCFANPNTELGNVIFDKAVIQNELQLFSGEYYLWKNPFMPKEVINVYSMAREAEAKGLFKALMGKKRKSFRQTDIYRALFGGEYKAHVAQDDVRAMVKIYHELKRLLEQEDRIFNAI